MLIAPRKGIAGFAKKDFLTIPDAPNYEINGYFQVRNKKSGRLKKSKKRVDRPAVVVSLRHKGKEIKRDVKTFYHQAVINEIYPSGWYPVNSLNNKYELNSEGRLRNAATKKLLKPVFDNNCLYYVLTIGGKSVNKMVGKLLEEVFGVPFKRAKKPIPVILQKGGLSYSFKSQAAAARFLSPKVFFGVETIVRRMSNREPVIYGWEIKYLG